MDLAHYLVKSQVCSKCTEIHFTIIPSVSFSSQEAMFLKKNVEKL